MRDSTTVNLMGAPYRQLALAANAFAQLYFLWTMRDSEAALRDFRFEHVFFFSTALLTAVDFMLLRRWRMHAFSVAMIFLGVIVGLYGALDVQYWAVGIVLMGVLPLTLWVIAESSPASRTQDFVWWGFVLATVGMFIAKSFLLGVP